MLFSRIGVYMPLPGVDVKAFQQSVQTGGGLLGYIDTLSGGSISRVGVFSLGLHCSCTQCQHLAMLSWLCFVVVLVLVVGLMAMLGSFARGVCLLLFGG